jgi:putative ABC transport system permease protein
MTVPLALLKSKQRTQRVFNLVLITIAGISLLVGGIGIMNIMLTTVMERIREIGIRRAVGASRRDIFLQFLAETLTLSSMGGVFGVALGLAMVPVAAQWTKWPGIVTPSSVILSLLVASCVGLVFGTAPAIRASRLNPVDALRHE